MLIVDDDRIYQFTARKLMKATGNAGDITVSSNGKEALEYLESMIQSQSALPDVIFLDLNMPVMGGWEFLEAYKEVKNRLPKEIRIYIVSSSADTVDTGRSTQYDTVKGYMLKPVLKEKFNQVLTAVSAGL